MLPQEHLLTFLSLGSGSHTQETTQCREKKFQAWDINFVWLEAPPLSWIGALSALKTATLNTLRARLEHTLPIASVDTTSLRTLLPIIRSHKPADDIIKIFIFMGSSFFQFSTIQRFGNEGKSSLRYQTLEHSAKLCVIICECKSDVTEEHVFASACVSLPLFWWAWPWTRCWGGGGG